MTLSFRKRWPLIVLVSAVAGRLPVDAKDAVFKPIALTGWNTDVVFENAASPAATSFDNLIQRQADAPLYALFESGLQGHADGLPASRQLVSAMEARRRGKLPIHNAPARTGRLTHTQ